MLVDNGVHGDSWLQKAARSAGAAEPKRYRDAYDEAGLLDQWRWETQAAVLDGLYTRLLAGTSPSQHQTTGGAL